MWIGFDGQMPRSQRKSTKTTKEIFSSSSQFLWHSESHKKIGSSLVTNKELNWPSSRLKSAFIYSKNAKKMKSLYLYLVHQIKLSPIYYRIRIKSLLQIYKKTTQSQTFRLIRTVLDSRQIRKNDRLH